MIQTLENISITPPIHFRILPQLRIEHFFKRSIVIIKGMIYTNQYLTLKTYKIKYLVDLQFLNQKRRQTMNDIMKLSQIIIDAIKKYYNDNKSDNIDCCEAILALKQAEITL